MSTERIFKKPNEHLKQINQKFDELDELITNYLKDIRKNGGTTGFCIGSLREKIRFYRGRFNNMCGKFSNYNPKINSNLIDRTEGNSDIYSNEYWEGNLKFYLSQKHPDKLKYNPRLIKVTKDHIRFGMKKHMGILILSKKKIIETLFPD